jgi:hypothetical protein
MKAESGASSEVIGLTGIAQKRDREGSVLDFARLGMVLGPFWQ